MNDDKKKQLATAVKWGIGLLAALFVTREYKTARMTDGLAKLRACALASLDDLKETTGTHPAWQGVDGNNKGKWAWYELRSGK